MKAVNNLIKQFPLVYSIKFVFLEIFRRIISRHSYLAYSQTGEDIIIQRILDSISNGFYVEVGSNEPIQHSNTFGLYQKGWRGITIDANNKMVDMHRKIRPKDESVCAAISDEEQEVTFYEFDMDEISTIDVDFYIKNKDEQNLISQTKIKTQTLDSILDKYLPVDIVIDLLSIDVEGHDFHVLRSINLNKHRPKLIVIEMHNFSMLDPMSNDIYLWMVSNNYKIVGYAVWNGYFISNEFDVNG